MIAVRCPFCGEPIETRHTFCVVCGSDLQEVLAQTPQEKLGEAGRKIRTVLTRPIVLPGKQKAAAEAPAPEPVQPPQKPEREDPAPAAIPPLMKHSLT